MTSSEPLDSARSQDHEIDDDERALMDRALEENAVIIAQMTPYFADEASQDDPRH